MGAWLPSLKALYTFRIVLQFYKLGDLSYFNQKFTQSNNRRGGTFTKERLDRAVATKHQCEMFGDGEVDVLSSSTFISVITFYVQYVYKRMKPLVILSRPILLHNMCSYWIKWLYKRPPSLLLDVERLSYRDLVLFVVIVRVTQF